MNKQLCLRLLLVTTIVALLPACASNSGSPSGTRNASPIAATTEVITHRVVSGDRLSDIAKRYTGSAETWRDIALFNEISNPRKLRLGAKIEIPMTLVAGYVDSRGNAARNEPPKMISSAPASKTTAKPEVDSASVVVQRVENNRNFELKPLPLDQSQRASAASTYLKIVGSYYPKVVYSQPASYSALLLRVAPGTLFEFDRKVDDWYKVNTDKGAGYVRDIDGLIIE